MSDPSEKSSAQATSLRAMLSSQKAAIIVLSAVTLAVFLGIYILARASEAPNANCLLAALAAGTIWVAVAAPLASAGSPKTIESLVRMAAVVDSAGVALVVVWLLGLSAREGRLEFLPAVEIYCVYAAMGFFGLAAVSMARSPHGRYTLAAVAATILLLAAATPFWINGLIEHSSPQARRTIVSAAVACNPFYAITSSVVEQTNLVWHQAPVLYDITRIGEYNAPGPAKWYPFVIGCVALAAAIAAVGRLTRRLTRA